MAKIKKFTPAVLKKFRVDFEKSVAAFAKTQGVVMKLEGARYGSADATYKLKVVLAPNASGMSAEEVIGRSSLDLEGVFFGLTADDYGRTWKSWDGHTYKLVGIKSSRPKYPVSGVHVKTGKGFKFEENIIKKLSKRVVKK